MYTLFHLSGLSPEGQTDILSRWIFQNSEQKTSSTWGMDVDVQDHGLIWLELMVSGSSTNSAFQIYVNKHFILDAILVFPSTNQSWVLDQLEFNSLENRLSRQQRKVVLVRDLSNTSKVQVLMTEIVSELQVTPGKNTIQLDQSSTAPVSWKPNERYGASVDTLGVLEILWLDGSREIADVEDPSTGNLYRAGMFPSADLSTRRQWAD
ncbi:hypothetical protein C8J56DRAFT_888352 [Mycena floridula]|nr:hypothetical protein C8J56DRAFT_888352 [Mycena floridula]